MSSKCCGGGDGASTSPPQKKKKNDLMDDVDVVVNTLSILFDRMILMKHIQDGAQPMMKSAFLRMSKFIHKNSNKNEKEGEAMPLVDDMPAEVVDHHPQLPSTKF